MKKKPIKKRRLPRKYIDEFGRAIIPYRCRCNMLVKPKSKRK